MKTAARAWATWMSTREVRCIPRSLGLVVHGTPLDGSRPSSHVARTGWRAVGVLATLAGVVTGMCDSVIGAVGTAYAGLTTLGGRRHASAPRAGAVLLVGLAAAGAGLIAGVAPVALGGALLAPWSGDVHSSAEHAGTTFRQARAARVGTRRAPAFQDALIDLDGTAMHTPSRQHRVSAPSLAAPEQQRQREGRGLGD